MKTKLNGILTLLLALVVQVAFAQQTVTGKVTDPEGAPILGATVLVKGSSNATTTDFDGNYTISANSEDTLVFSFSGYDSVEKVVGNQTTINTTLSTSLDAVVVQAYRSASSATSNVAATTVSGEDTQDRPNASILQRLQGQVPGLIVQTGTGQPGANSTIQLRGISSINGNTEPLIIVDGVPVDEDTFRSFNPNDVESTTVLKDAAATAIYGNRGANGVIIITTKGGKFNSPLRISYNGTTSFSSFIDRDYDLYDAPGYLRLERRQNTGLGQSLTDAEIDNFTVSQSFQDYFFRTGVNQSHNLSLTSGGENSTQFTSLNYTNQEGTLINTGIQRFNFRTNITGKSDNGKFRYSTNALMGYSKNESQTETTNGRNNFIYFSSIQAAFNARPYLDPADYRQDPASLLSYFNGIQLSPFVVIDNNLQNINRDDELKLILGGDFAYDISDEFTLRYRLGVDYQNVIGIRANPPTSALSLIRGAGQLEGDQSESFLRDFRFNSNLNLGWEKRFGSGTEAQKKHRVLANAYVEYVKGELKSFNYNQNGLDPRTFAFGDGAGYLTDGSANDIYVPTVGSNKNSVGLFSYFGEVDYDYDEKYGFTGTLRRDASFRFTDDNAYGTFYSVAGRWNIHKEDFLADSDVVNNLKLRVSYGVTGNDRILGGYYAGLSNIRQLFVTGLGYNDTQTFVRSGTLANPDLKWENVSTLNIGLEFGLFDNRLRGSLELYDRETTDLFFSTFVSGINGTYSTTANIGDLYNRGVELGANYDLIRAEKDGDFAMSVYANVSYNENEVTFVDLPDGRQDNTGAGTVIEIGRQINEYFVVPYVGVNPANGNLLFEDIDGNITENITSDDRRHTGTSFTPDFQGGFGTNLSFKNFFLSADFVYMTGIDRFDLQAADYLDPDNIGLYQVSSAFERAWTPDNRVTDIPAISATNLAANGINTDRFLRESDFLRLRFLQIGYNLPQSLVEKSFINSARIYANAENLLTFTKWRGSDPERPSNIDQNRYPTSRIVSLGVDINF